MAYGRPPQQPYGGYPQQQRYGGPPGGVPGPPGGAKYGAAVTDPDDDGDDVGGYTHKIMSVMDILKQHAPPGTTFDSFGAPSQQVATWGKKRSLLIGINYFGQKGQLNGCINDVKTMQQLLKKIGFPLQDSRVLCDDTRDPRTMPTKKNIVDSMKWLVHGAQPGDCFFFHFSGHGSQVKDTSGDEDDGWDETLVPVDFRTTGHIVDDDIHKMLVKSLPKGAKLTAVCDCCHSGTCMDLPFTFTARKQLSRGSRGLHMEVEGSARGVQSRAPGRMGGGGRPVDKLHGEVVQFSGCADTQTSADVGGNAGKFFDLPSGPGGAGGACTNALAAALHKSPNLTFTELLEEMRQVLQRKNFKQVPQLSSSLPVNLNQPFSLDRLLTGDREAPQGRPQGGGGGGGGYGAAPPAHGGKGGGYSSAPAHGGGKGGGYAAAPAHSDPFAAAAGRYGAPQQHHQQPPPRQQSQPHQYHQQPPAQHGGYGGGYPPQQQQHGAYQSRPPGPPGGAGWGGGGPPGGGYGGGGDDECV